MQEIDLYQPSLTDGWKRTKSFNIRNFILIAVLGGAVPLMIVGVLNAKWLRAPRKAIYLLVSAGLVLEAIKWLLYVQSTAGIIPINSGTINIGYRVACAILFFNYFQMLKQPFSFHMRTVGETKFLFQPGVYLIALGILIDFVGFIFIM